MSYRSDWRATPCSVRPVTLSDGTIFLRMRRRYLRAEKWGLFAFSDPARPACKAPVLWLPQMSRRTVRARCNMPLAGRPASVMTLASFRAKRIAIRSVDGTSVIMMKRGGLTTSLVAHGWPVLTQPARVTFEFDGFEDLTAHIDGLQTLERLANPTIPIPIPPFPPATHERLRQALLALDGSLAGATYRQIAKTIFGDERVCRDWDAASRFLKERTRRLVAKGRELMNGGYRDLLR